MQIKTIIGAALLAALSGTAAAGDVTRSDSLNQYGDMVTAFEAEYLVPGALNKHMSTPAGNNNDATTAGFRFDSLSNAIGDPNAAGFNGAFDVSIELGAAQTGDFYFRETDGLRNIDFNAGDEPRPSDNTLAIAFGNELWTSNDLVMTLAPGVTAFGFNYEDIGDVGGTLTVEFSTGDFTDIVIGPGNQNAEKDGFISVIADKDAQGGAEFITSITFTQTPGTANDGFIFYGFASVQTIPLPPAAFAGLGLLRAMAGVRKLRQR